jgi:CubicO group peptidase (beta-lactamase class C family)
MMNPCVIAFAFAMALTRPAVAQSDLQIKSDDEIHRYLLTRVEKHELPGIVAGIAQPNQLRIGAAGFRKIGDRTQIGIHDTMHLGSCTKAITATMIGRLVDQKMMNWDQTIAETLPDFSKSIHEDYAKVTLYQLLAHRSGMPVNGDWWAVASSGADDLTQRRTQIAIGACSKKPAHAPGTKFEYSNLGYVVAALMATKVTGRDWETLIEDEIFKPLGMDSAGFGPPGTKDQVDQPWGHRMSAGHLKPTQLDNSPTLGPAGTIHANLEDWAKFAMVHADTDNEFISPETRQRIQTPLKGQDHALGWIVTRRPWANGIALTHSGSNTAWFCTLWVAPQIKRAYLAATNAADDHVPKVIDGVIAKLIELDRK